MRQPPRVDVHATLGAAIGKADDSTFPRHQHRHRLDGVECEPGLVADAALGRPAADVVLDAKACEELDREVVHVDREVDDEFALDLPEQLTNVVRKCQDLGCGIELMLRRRVGGH